MPWTKVDIGDGILTMWPGMIVQESDSKELGAFFRDRFDIDVEPIGCVITSTGRCDFFFVVQDDDVMKFACARLPYRMRWWEDVSGEERASYPSEFLDAYSCAK